MGLDIDFKCKYRVRLRTFIVSNKNNSSKNNILFFTFIYIIHYIIFENDSTKITSFHPHCRCILECIFPYSKCNLFEVKVKVKVKVKFTLEQATKPQRGSRV